MFVVPRQVLPAAGAVLPAVVVAIAAALVMVIAAGCGERLPTSPEPGGPGPAARGITLGDWSRSGYSSPSCRLALDEIAALGANRVVFLANAYQPTATSSSIDRGGSATDLEAFRIGTGWAMDRGLVPVLKLHVDILDGTWRAHLRPDDPAAWFASYGDFVTDCAVVAEETGVQSLVVGTELAGLNDFEAEWRSIIAAVRDVFDGEVLYAASWDEVQRVPFWDALDAIGVDFYAPVASRDAPSRFEILAGWQPWLDRLDRLHRAVGRDVVLTEIGYTSRDGAGRAPMRYGPGGVPDPGEQADLYAAAMIAVSGAPWIRGVYWWNWEVGVAGGPMDTGYTPRGKPAEQELAAAWGGSP
jgi:hypothetical protein